MDAAYFLQKRTRFIRFYYDESVKRFEDIKSLIESEQPPYDDPPYSEDPEPPFLEEWMDAQTAINVLGLSCVSLLSDSLKLYFQALKDRVIGFSFSNEQTEKPFRHGFVAAYKAILGEILDTDWSDCPVDFAIIEQVVLARNRGQHGSNFTSFDIWHDDEVLRKHSRPFFADERYAQAWVESNKNSFMTPALEVTRDRLFGAVGEAEKLANWIESRLDKAWEWRTGDRSR